MNQKSPNQMLLQNPKVMKVARVVAEEVLKVARVGVTMEEVVDEVETNKRSHIVLLLFRRSIKTPYRGFDFCIIFSSSSLSFALFLS